MTTVALTPTSLTGRWIRWITAAVVAVVGAGDVVSAATSQPPPRAGLLGVDYALAAITGARYVLLAAGVAALLVVRGLLHGKRAAWWIALLAAVASLPGHHVMQQDVLGGAAVLVVLPALLATRRMFTARSDPAMAHRGSAVLVGGLAAGSFTRPPACTGWTRSFATRPRCGRRCVMRASCCFYCPSMWSR